MCLSGVWSIFGSFLQVLSPPQCLLLLSQERGPTNFHFNSLFLLLFYLYFLFYTTFLPWMVLHHREKKGCFSGLSSFPNHHACSCLINDHWDFKGLFTFKCCVPQFLTSLCSVSLREFRLNEPILALNSVKHWVTWFGLVVYDSGLSLSRSWFVWGPKRDNSLSHSGRVFFFGSSE